MSLALCPVRPFEYSPRVFPTPTIKENLKIKKERR
jgi:hypothetical protein